MLFSLEEIILLFFIYSFLGWCVEVAFVAITLKEVSNRGFLNGPVCPIYGVGMLGVLFALTPLKNNLILLFLGGIIICSAVELCGGWILDKIFHMRWWDYSDKPFNIGGYVCLEFSLMWGVAVVFAVKIVHTPIIAAIHRIPLVLERIWIVVFIIIFATDMIVTIKNLAGIRKNLGQLDKLAEELQNIGNQLKDVVGNSALTVAEKAGEQKEIFDEKAAPGIEELERRREILIENIQAASHRIWTSLPTLNRHGKSIKIKEYIELLRDKQKAGVQMNFKGKNFLKLLDFTPEEINTLLDFSAELKAKKKAEKMVDVLRGKNIAVIFEKTSTRTRCSFEVAAHDLGMGVTYLDPSGSQIGKKESIADTARVLGRMFDGIEYRGFEQNIVEQLAKYAGVPVWNGLTNESHPTQILADFLTLREKFGTLKGLKFVYMGDARYNMGNSLMVGCAKMGINFVACAPKKYFPDPKLIEICKEIGQKTGAAITFEEDPMVATKGANVIYTDVWVSMGEPDEVWEERIRDLLPYRVTMEMIHNGADNIVFMHCLPAFHDLNTKIGKEIYQKFGLTEMEVTDEVFESEYSVVFDEAENRMHTIKAVMAATLGAKL